MSRTVQEIMEAMGKSVEASMVLERKSGSSYAQIADIKSEDINELRYYFDGALYCSVMRCLEVKLKGNWTSKVKRGLLLDSVTLTLTHPEGDTARIIYGGYIVAEEPEYDAAQNVTSVIAYDALYPSMQLYAMNLDWTNGITVKNYLIAILNKLGIAYAEDSFELMANADVKITSEKFLDIENDNTESAYTYRDVLDEIAKASGVTFVFKNSLGGDPFKLYAVKPTESGYVIDESNLHSVTVGAKYGPVKAVMLSREPQEDNVYLKADGYKSTDATVKISNVEIMEDSDNDSYRENFMSGILSNVLNTEYYLYELDSFGIGFLNFGDIFTIKACDREGGVIGAEKSYETIFMRTDMTIGNGVKEKSRLEAPQATSPDYAAASTTDKVLKKTMLKVDKQKQEITALAKESEEKFTQLKQTTDGLYADINDAENGLKAAMTATAEKAESAFEKATAVENAGYITTEDAKTLISQSADNITLEVEQNIKIGARNILLDSACFASLPVTGRTSDISATLKSSNDTPSGKQKVILFRPQSTGLRGFQFFSNGLLGEADGSISKVRPNTTYTLSWWMRYNDTALVPGELSKSNLLYVGDGKYVIYDDQRCTLPAISNSWQRYTATFKTPSEIPKFSIRFFFANCAKVDGDTGYWIELSSLKLEEGNIATDWTPSAEDVEQSVKAQISMCVQKDKNGNLTSAIAIAGNQISIESDNFVLTKDGTITKCNGAQITNGVIKCGDDNFNMTIGGGIIVHTFNDTTVGQITTMAVPDDNNVPKYYETMLGNAGVCLSAPNCFAYLDEQGLLIQQSADKTFLNVMISKTEDWSYGSITSALRSAIVADSGLILSANSGQNDLMLQGNNVWLCGHIRIANYYKYDSENIKEPLYVNTTTGEITT